MTREEAIKQIESLFEHCEAMMTSDEPVWSQDCEALKVALSALRGPTREQVEKMRGRFFQAGIDDVAQDTWRCSWCLVQEFGDIRGINFCPHCGAPMTDAAVDMVMKRLEALYGQENT